MFENTLKNDADTLENDGDTLENDGDENHEKSSNAIASLGLYGGSGAWPLYSRADLLEKASTSYLFRGTTAVETLLDA